VTEIAVQVGALSLRLQAARAVDLPVRGILSDAGIESGWEPRAASREPKTDVERVIPVAAKSRARIGATIGEAELLITDPATGKYPHPSPFRDELVRALRFAAQLWGAETSWAAIDESHWTALLRRRCEQLVAKDCKAVRATEITVSRLITVVGWLRDTKRISRDAAAWPRDWKRQITVHWKGVTGSDRDPQPDRQRYTLEEFQRILANADFDPRLDLLLRLAVGLRPGQVARARRSDLKLPPIVVQKDERGNDLTDYGTLVVHGAGKKGGGVVDLTRGQRAIVEHALSGNGYLARVEGEYQRKERADYRLFPSGYVVGRVGMLRGKATKLALASGADFARHVTPSWIRKNWRRAEARAGIEHLTGRCTYGQRRLTVDVGVAEGLSPSGIQGIGLWADTTMPLTVYAEAENRAGRREARPVRARMLGEDDDRAGARS
jgi:hypothetical protein